MPNRLHVSLLLIAALVAPARAQTPPSPASGASDQVIPPVGTLGHGKSTQAKPASGKATGHTPVVQAPKNGHAQKPQGAATKPGTAKAPPGGKPQPVVPPPPAPAPAVTPAEPPKGTATGLPLPRWASLRADEVNLRSGPGTRYPIEWVYRRRDLPVQIEREFETWRLVQDQDGVKGWVHSATLTGRRGFVVQGGEQVMRGTASDDGEPVARLKQGVVGRIRGCEATAMWCDVQVGDYRGWLKREAMWGISPGEAVN